MEPPGYRGTPYHQPRLACSPDGIDLPDIDILLIYQIEKLRMGRLKVLWREEYWLAELDIVPASTDPTPTEYNRWHYTVVLRRRLTPGEVTDPYLPYH